jgi:FkbM family methyltransferase
MFRLLKYKIARYIERYPKLNLFIYNFIPYLPFLLPHEKDYLALKHLLKKKSNISGIFLDVGANNGISTMGFRKLGFDNEIYLFEPNTWLYKKYLIKLKKNFKNKIFNFSLGDKNEMNYFYEPYLDKKCLHYFASFDKNYIINSIKITSPKYLDKIFFKKKKIKQCTYDSLQINKNIVFIKIDVEGYDHLVIKGMLKSIKKYKPIIFVEYNVENIKKICFLLKNYDPFIYINKFNKLLSVKKDLLFSKQNKVISRSNKENLLSIRNIFFIERNKVKKYFNHAIYRKIMH